MKFCIKCGVQKEKEQKFCKKCGHHFRDAKSEKPTAGDSNSGKYLVYVIVAIALIVGGILAVSHYGQMRRDFEQKLRQSELASKLQAEQNQILQEQKEAERANALAAENARQSQAEQAEREKEIARLVLLQS